MASRQRSRPPKKQRAPNPLADLGIFDIPDLNMDVDDDGGDDSDVDESALESELELILSGKGSSRPARPKKKVAQPVDIERMASECMKDLDEDEDDDDDSVLTDVALLKELQGLSFDSPEGDGERTEKDDTHESVSPTEEAHPASEPTPKVSGNIVVLLEERLKLYNEAVAASKAMGDNSKARRYSRAVKTLEGLVKSAKSGRVINEEDIPPVVNIPKKASRPPPPPPPAECVNVSDDVPIATSGDEPAGNLIDISFSDTTPEPACEKPVIEDEMTDASKLLTLRRNQYKVAALQAKRAGDKATALKYMKMAKTFDSVLEALKNGESVDISSIPPAPDAYVETVAPSATDPPQKELQETQTSSSIEAAALSAASEPADPALFEAPPAPTSVLEALQQRLEKYTATKAAAEAEGNSSKVRRLQRIIKSYEKAIKDFKAGKPVDFEELATPPGFAPIPVPSQTNASQPSEPSSKPAPAVPAEKPKPEVKPHAPKRPAPQVPSKPAEQQKPKLQRTNTSTYEKQLEFLLERQRLFREAAISAKKNGDLQQAKQYLAMSKGFNSMIEASKSGLPIDASSIPTPPQLESDFVVVDVSECMENEGSELIETLENDLKQQIEVCTRNKEHFLRLGDVSSASKFEKLGLESRKDLSVIHHLKKTGSSAPKFHYETRLFSMVQCHTDLGDNDFEVTVERGINLPGKPDDLDSYVRVDFPIPSDAPQRAKTQTIRDTNNPIFQEEFKFEFSRKSRAQLRQFKRGALKLEVWSKGCYCLCFSGFLRSDTLLGTAHVKLVDLESKCVIHDCFDLMDGRKACGGKLEVKVRIRDPLFAKQVEQVREKWLVIGS